MSDIVQIDKARLARIRASAGAGEPGDRFDDDIPPPAEPYAIEVVDVEHHAERERALAIIDAPPAPTVKRRSRPLAEWAADVIKLRDVPMWSFGFPEIDRKAPTPAGSNVDITGATGRGKSAMTMLIATCHARNIGPAIIASAELAGAVAAARIVSQVTGASWSSVFCGDVDPATIHSALDVSRLRLLDEVGVSWATDFAIEIQEAQREHPGRIVLLVVDYLQLLRVVDAKTTRERVEIASVTLRDLAKRTGAVILRVVRSGRNASRAQRAGEMVGTDATEAGAESGQIEHDVVSFLSLGAMTDPDEQGWSTVDVSIVKARFGQSNVVIPMRFHGASGQFEVAGEAVPASERKAAAKLDRKVEEIGKALAGTEAPLTRNALAEMIGGSRKDALAAIRTALASGLLVSVSDPEGDPRSHPVMLRAVAEAKGYRRPPPGAPESAPWGAP